jgi:antitoxin (DNA-binding transcriptional repressor) of toxin-antitoxin stability system
MKTASVRDLRNRYAEVLRWLETGQDVAIKRRGRVVARLTPESEASAEEVDWNVSAAARRDRRRDPLLSASQAAAVLRESQG